MTPPHRVLLIEDDESIRSTLKLALEMEGYSVLEAENGEEGLAQLPQKPDLIIVDVMMPRMDGREFLERKNQQPEYSAIPVIVLSASVRLLKAPEGASSSQVFLEKPIDLARLMNEIARLVPTI